MNRVHRRICASPGWAEMVREELLPWALDGYDHGRDVLEIGPGYGATTRVLAGRVAAARVDVTAKRLRFGATRPPPSAT